MILVLPDLVGASERVVVELDQSGTVDQPVEHGQLERVDDVLGVVKHDRSRGAVLAKLISEQRVVEMVEAIGLGRRTVGMDEHRLDARIVDADDRRSGRRVVLIVADEDPVIGVFEPLHA